jgi:aryl-alcohol dehydrogenase-like predicted oxidoreductase
MQLEENIAWFDAELPESLWADLDTALAAARPAT